MLRGCGWETIGKPNQTLETNCRTASPLDTARQPVFRLHSMGDSRVIRQGQVKMKLEEHERALAFVVFHKRTIGSIITVRPTPHFMPKPDHVLSFATDKEGDQLFIHADAKGLDCLIRSLTHIRKKLDEDYCEHDHLMTDAWAGRELSERSIADGVHLIHHVKIYGWTPEWIQKHGLSVQPLAAGNAGFAPGFQAASLARRA